MKDSFKAFLADIIAKVPEDKRAMVEETLTAESVVGDLQGAFLRQSDYSRNMDRLRDERREFEAMVAEANANIEGWQEYIDTKQQEIESMRSEQNPSGEEGWTREALLRELAQRDNMAIRLADVMTDIKAEHRERFGERLDTSAVMQLAAQKNLSFEHAYREFVGPREEERRKKEQEELIAKAREEGAREYATKNRLPIVPSHAEPHSLDLAAAVKANSNDRVAAAVAAFNKAT